MTDIPPLPDDLVHGTMMTTTSTSTPSGSVTMMKNGGNSFTTTTMARQSRRYNDDTDTNTNGRGRQQQQQHHHDHEEEIVMRRLHQQQQQLIQQEESVLADILEELDRERHRRAEMEAKVRVLEEDLHSERTRRRQQQEQEGANAVATGDKSGRTTPAAATSTAGLVPASIRDLTRLQAECDGYKQIVEALTQDRPAFSTAIMQSSDTNDSKSNSSTKNKMGWNNKHRQSDMKQLPIHIVRLLEVMPWDPRAQSYIFGHEQVWEWQMLGADKTWKKELNHFPTFFKSLPVTLPSNGRTIQQQIDNGIFGRIMSSDNIAPPKKCVLTNLDASQILNIDKGYPLPDDGGDWMWISNWIVEKTNDTDEQGWSYSNDYQIMASSTYYNEFTPPTRGRPAVPRRRRKWMRRRMLFNYPYASTMTQEYLKLLSKKAILDVTLDKVSTQLVETKMGLTTIEADRFAFEERTNQRIRQLEMEVHEKNRLLEGVGIFSNKNKSTTRPETPSKKTDQIAAEIGSAVQQWVSNIGQSHKKQNSHDTGAVIGSTGDRNNSFGNSSNDSNDDGQDSSLETNHNTNTTPTLTQQQQQQQMDPPAMSPPHSPKSKQHLFDSLLRGKGTTDFFEKFKQNAGQEIDKFKHGLGGNNNNSSHDGKKKGGSDVKAKPNTKTNVNADSGISRTSTTNASSNSNIYVPATKKKLETSTFNESSIG